MSILVGPTIDDGLYDVWTGEVYFETAVVDPVNADVGELVELHSSYYKAVVSIETAAAAVPKVGVVVADYDLNFAMEAYGELG